MAKVVSISDGQSVSERIADLAFGYWLASCFSGEAPEQYFLQAMLEVIANQKNGARTGLCLVPKDINPPRRPA